jgi:transposase
MDTSEKPEILSSTASGVEEGSVINQTLWGAIQALGERGFSKSAIARELGIDIKTVRKWLSTAWEPQRRRPRSQPLTAFEPFLRARAPEVDFNATVLLRELRVRGYEGSYQPVVRLVRPWRLEARGEVLPTPRFETEPGKQAQVDWGSTGLWFGLDTFVRVHLFVMVLGYSRRIFARAYLNERLDSLLDAHAAAFSHFGGRTESALYDNPRTIVLRKDERTGEVLEWNKTFKDRMDFYGLDIRLCRYYRAQTKGKVESGVKYVKRNALAGRRFRDIEELNAWLLEWCLTVADQRIHGTTHERPAERFEREEAARLIAVSDRTPPPRERSLTRRVPSDAFVMVETNRYPVPLEWVGQDVGVRVRAEQILIGRGDGEAIAYDRLNGRHGVARWAGAPRSLASATPPSAGPPRWDPYYVDVCGEVEMRSLDEYDAVLEEVGG